MKYSKGLIEIVQRQRFENCTTCDRDLKEPIEIRRRGKTIGYFGPKCAKPIVEKVIKANEKSQFGLILPGMNFVDYFKRPTVRNIRGFEAKLARSKRIGVMNGFLKLKDGQYLHITDEVELKPEFVKNWRKKGKFVQVYVPTKDEINAKRLTPKKVAKKHIGENFLAYAGMIYFNKADNTNRIYSLMSLIEGKKIAYLCNKKGIEEKIEIESDQGPNKVLVVPSTSKKGKYHKVKLKNLPVETKDMYSRAFEFDFESTSEDAAYNNLPWSNVDTRKNGKYRFSPVRPDKFACAALEYLLSRKNNDILVDPRPVVPSNLACKLENTMLTRGVHGHNLLDGEDIEIQLWMMSKKLGYEKMFEK